MNALVLKKSQQILQNYFELDKLSEDDDYQKILDYLTEEVAHLMEYDFERLLYILYRIDVSEQKVKLATAESGLNEAPRKIAELIIQRQIEKVKTRKEYSQNS